MKKAAEKLFKSDKSPFVEQPQTDFSLISVNAMKKGTFDVKFYKRFFFQNFVIANQNFTRFCILIDCIFSAIFRTQFLGDF